MKNKRKNILITLLVMIFVFNICCIEAYATDVVATESQEVINNEITPRGSGDILLEGGRLSHGIKTYTVNFPRTATYTVTIAVQQIEGSGGLWVVLQDPQSVNKIDTTVTSSYQRRIKLNPGTYNLSLVASGTCAYSVVISDTTA